MYWALAPLSFSLFSELLSTSISASAFCTISSYFFTFSNTSPYSFLDQILRVLVNLFNLVWKIHIGSPITCLFQQFSIVCRNVSLSVQQLRNLKYLITVVWILFISNNKGQWSDPTKGKWVILLWGIMYSHLSLTIPLSNLFQILAPSFLWLHQV